MTEAEIIEIFIRAAEIDRKLPDTASPKPLRAQALPYVHDAIDQAGWGGERYIEERDAFFTVSMKMMTSDIGIWEQATDLIVLIDDESQRRCIWAWSKAKAGGMPFSKWCRNVEHIHVETGQRRRARGIASISCNLVRKSLKNQEIDVSALLPVAPQISDKPDRLAAFTWRDDWQFQRGVLNHDFAWAEGQNSRRRDRDKKRQQATAQ